MGASKNIEIRVNVQVTGLASLQQLAQALSQISAAQKSMTTSVASLHKAMNKTQQTVKKQTQAVQGLSGAFKKFTQDMTHNIYKVLEWGVATGIIYGSIRALRQALLDVGDVDFAIAGLTKVMNDAGDRSRKLARDVQVLASVYGEMGDVMITGTTEWARLQGSNLEIIEGTTAALLAQAVAEMSVVDATKYLIAELKQFEQPILNAVKLIDQWNELSNTFAVRAIDIAQSAARAGSVMHNTGVEMERLHAYTTALVESTGRAGTAIGTALRTFGVYAYRLETVNKLAGLTGMAITDLTGAQRGLGDIIGQIATKWGTYTDEQQKAIAQTIAGTRRSNEFLTLMEQYPTVLNALVQSYRSVGSAQKEAAIYLNTVRKQLDITRSLMQRLVTEGGLLASMFKNIVSVLNSFIAGMIVLKPVIITATVALVAFRIAVYAANVGLGYLYATTLAFLIVQHPLAAAITALAIILAGVTTAIGYYTRKEEAAIEKSKQMAEAALANAKALGAEAERLSTLVNIYENYRKALEAGAAEPGMFNQKQMERMADNLNEIGKQIARITGVPFKELELSATGWADSLEEVRNKLAEIGTQAKEANEIQKEYWADQIEQQRKVVNFWTILQNKLKQIPKGPEQLGMRFGAIAEALRESELSFKKIGEYTRFVRTEGFEAIPKALDEANAQLDQFESNLKSLQSTAGELEDVLLPEDIDKLLDALTKRLGDLEDEYDYLTARFKFAGKTQTEVSQLALESIDAQIAAVKALADKYKTVDKIQEEAQKALIKLYRERSQQEYKLIESGFVDREKDLNDNFKKQIASMRSQVEYTARYAQETKGAVAASEERIKGIQQEIAAYENQIAEYRRMKWDAEDLEDSLDKLNLQFDAEKKVLENLLRPMKQYDKAIERINTITSRASILLQARGASELKLARIEEEAAKRRKDLAKSGKDKEAAEAALQLAIARREAAEIAEKYEKATKNINTELQKNTAISQASGASAIFLAQMQVQAAQERIDALQGQDEKVIKLAKDELDLANIQLLAANIAEKRNRLVSQYQVAIERLTMSQEQEIATLDLLGVTDEMVAKSQVEHAKEVLDQIRRNAKAYSSMNEWQLALLDALRAIRSAEAAVDRARMDRIRKQVREEYDMLQAKHDHQVDLMDALGSTTRQQIEERMVQLGQEFEFVVTNSRLTADQRRDMAQDLYRDLMSISRQYEIDEIDRAKGFADAYLSQYIRIEDAWYTMIGNMATGDPLKAILDRLDSMLDDWVRKQAEKKFGGLVEKLTGFELKLTGMSPAEMRAEEERQKMMLDSMIQGGDYVEQSIKDGVTSMGQQIRDWVSQLEGLDIASPVETALIKGGDSAELSIRHGADYFAQKVAGLFPMPESKGEMFQVPGKGYEFPDRVPTGLSQWISDMNAESENMSKGITESMSNSTDALTENLADTFALSINWLYSSLTRGANVVGSAIEKAGKVAGQQISSDMKQAATKGGEDIQTGMSGMDKAMTAYALLRSANIPDWTQKRGGGWRAAGYGVGAGIGTIIAPGIGTVIGAQVGQEIVSKGQDLWRWLSSDAEATARAPKTESLREQLSGTISRGQFRDAANITYNIQNTVVMDYFIPDAAQMKRATPIIKSALEGYGANVSVGR